MPTPFAINGLGRIGRALARVAADRPELQLVAVNDLTPASHLARLLARDSVHGAFAGSVRADADALWIDDHRLSVFQCSEPDDIPWQETEAMIVVDASGTSTQRQRAAGHLRDSGPSKVVISAISDDADLAVCRGLESSPYDPNRHHIISNASCTTNCLVLMLDVLQREIGIRHAMMSEVHSYTGNQNLLDSDHWDARRGRAAAVNIVPTFTAAPKAAQALMPELRGRIAGMAVRVPTPNVALLDLVVHLDRPTDVEELRELYRRAAGGRLSGLLGVSDEPLVSSDYVGDSHSAVIDLDLIQCLEPADPDGSGRRDQSTMARIVAWYDNEWGYAHRLADLVTLIGENES